MRLFIALALGAIAVVFFAPGGASLTQANNVTTFQTIFGTKVASAGYGGMRGIGTGTITLSGVSGSVTKAFLYWHGPTSTATAGANAAVNFAGNAITGTNIGVSQDNCWGFLNSQAYRADVTAFVSGNGAYSLSGFFKPNVADINGVSLIVFYNDGNPVGNRDVVIFDGNDSNYNNAFDANGWNATLSGINYTSGAATLDLHVSDGQTFTDDEVDINGSMLVPVGQTFEGNSTPFGAGGPANGSLWDIKSFPITSILVPGLNTLTLTTTPTHSGCFTSAGDALSLIVAMINLPAGAAPGQPTPTPTSTRTATATPTVTGATTTPTATATQIPTVVPTARPQIITDVIHPNLSGQIAAALDGAVGVLPQATRAAQAVQTSVAVQRAAAGPVISPPNTGDGGLGRGRGSSGPFSVVALSVGVAAGLSAALSRRRYSR